MALLSKNLRFRKTGAIVRMNTVTKNFMDHWEGKINESKRFLPDFDKSCKDRAY